MDTGKLYGSMKKIKEVVWVSVEVHTKQAFVRRMILMLLRCDVTDENAFAS